MEEQAVLDRVVDGEHAVLLVGPRERELIVPAAELPVETRPGSWLRVTTADDGRVTIVADAEATERATGRIRDKMERLRRRGRGDQD